MTTPRCQSAGCPKKKRHAATWVWSNANGWRMLVCDKVRDTMTEAGIPEDDFTRIEQQNEEER